MKMEWPEKILIVFICFMLILFAVEIVDLSRKQRVMLEEQQSRNEWGQTPEDAAWLVKRWKEVANASN